VSGTAEKGMPMADAFPGNRLFYGDNLKVLREHFKQNEAVDLIYLDPPFKSNRDYNIFFPEENGSKSEAQLHAFKDTWEWGDEAAKEYEETVEAGGDVARALQALRQILHQNDMMAYLSRMAIRLKELRRVLKPTGSIYLHCDPTASHYLKILLDSVFGPQNFLNEIIWHYRKWPSGKYTFQRNHDVIFFYSRSPNRDRPFNQLFMNRAPSTLKRFGTAQIVSGHDEQGRRIPSRMAAHDSLGVRQDDVWDIGRVPPIKQLFPTEKPVALLEKIITASTRKGDIVLDPFCGCGTAIVAAQRLGRRWIGIDVTEAAMVVIKRRLRETFGKSVLQHTTTVGEPESVHDARVLAQSDPYQFQWWALGLVDARPTEKKKGADQGIDGRLYFHDEPSGGATKQVIFSVKAGTVNPAHVRDLAHVVSREKAQVGALISMEEHTKAMRQEAASAGFYQSPGGTKHPRLQLLTVADLLGGKHLDLPPWREVRTFKRTERDKQIKMITPKIPKAK